MFNYVLIGIVCFVLGFAWGTLDDPYEDDEAFDADLEACDCKGCFGASFGDCDHCPKNQE